LSSCIIFIIFILSPVLDSCVNSTAEEIKESGFRKHKLYYENSGGERAITTFYYNTEGNNYMAHWQLEDSSRSSLNYHDIDPAGRLILKRRKFSDGIKSEQYFRYDSSGRILEQGIERSDGVSGTTYYKYDDAGRLKMADCRGLNTWFHGYIFYRFEEGIRTGADILREGDTIGTISYEWDMDRLVLEHWDMNGQWSQTFRWEYMEEAQGTCTSSNVFIRESPWYMIAAENYDYNAQGGGPSYYNYTDGNILENKEFQRSDGLRTMTRYEYDSTGILRYSYRAYDVGDTTVFHYWYGVNRELLVRTWERPDGSRGSETYRYDDEGRLIEGIYENLDGWLNGDLVFSNHERGKPLIATFTGIDGMNASINFAYDLNHNMERIHWVFDDGRTQTYTFSYTPVILR